MVSARKSLYAAAAVCAIACWGFEGAAQSLVTQVPAGGWPAAFEQIQKIKPDRSPYRLTHRCRAYDEVVHIQTPMVRAAAFVEASKREKKTVTPEQVAKIFDPFRLIIDLNVFHKNADKAGAVEISLLVDGKPVHPLQSTLITTELRSVGLYADPFYYSTKQFTFDMEQIKGAKELKVVIVESEDKDAEIHELPVDLTNLK
jgi:hypothetical protein